MLLLYYLSDKTFRFITPEFCQSAYFLSLSVVILFYSAVIIRYILPVVVVWLICPKSQTWPKCGLRDHTLSCSWWFVAPAGITWSMFFHQNSAPLDFYQDVVTVILLLVEFTKDKYNPTSLNDLLPATRANVGGQPLDECLHVQKI